MSIKKLIKNEYGNLAINEAVKDASAFTHPLFDELGKVIVGQNYLIERLVIGLLTNGHVLLEGVPGLAKTLTVKSLAELHPRQIRAAAIHARHAARRRDRHADLQSAIRRFQHAQRSDLRQPHPGRRNQPRAGQGAERAARSHAGTAGHHRRPDLQARGPFLVLATQNPIEQEGTYPLPEAQVDRFMLKVKIDYPTRDEERQILDLMEETSGTPVRAPG